MNKILIFFVITCFFNCTNTEKHHLIKEEQLMYNRAIEHLKQDKEVIMFAEQLNSINNGHVVMEVSNRTIVPNFIYFSDTITYESYGVIDPNRDLRNFVFDSLYELKHSLSKQIQPKTLNDLERLSSSIPSNILVAFSEILDGNTLYCELLYKDGLKYSIIDNKYRYTGTTLIYLFLFDKNKKLTQVYNNRSNT
ncbi:hypothetical protein [Flexithrix dorotheae]|uniref:hypothetical protein n=1 Tax=Flexithrix dorotheae TaxID=70993 RepID=UPI0003685FC5|nr:hypothetical protein [Flexithrix dorotheae]